MSFPENLNFNDLVNFVQFVKNYINKDDNFHK